MLMTCRYWEAKLANGHIPSEAYVYNVRSIAVPSNDYAARSRISSGRNTN